LELRVIEFIPLFMFLIVCLVLLLGYPVAFSLAGSALLFAGLGTVTGVFDSSLLSAVPSRIYGIMTNTTLIAVPLFVFMGVMLEKSRLAEDLLSNMAKAFGRQKGGLAYAVIIVGMLLAASTGIVGATVVTMGLMSLPTMLKQNYEPSLATGTICATGTLGQIIPPSIALVLLGDILSSSYQQAQLNMGIFSPKTVSVGDLFIGALIPGLMLVALYLLYAFIATRKKIINSSPDETKLNYLDLMFNLGPPLTLIMMVLGSILIGIATPTEAAAVGAMGATLIGLLKRKLSIVILNEVTIQTLKVTSMVFMILIGATIFSLVFRGYGGDELVHSLFLDMPGGEIGALLVVMLVIFLLGFILDFIEITFVVVPIVAPILLALGFDPIWLGIMIAINLQTSFLTPPFGFALFYLRGVAPKNITTITLYRGVIPFIIIQLAVLIILAIWPSLATWLPAQIYN
jgi:tripartite ATP-independent transporter DctM subunit